ncbi:MAG: hypothetical protein SP1CHLAM54_08440 [Chlamydiia bacterium]|nr:hypothetical protein [Chlamydiia bacterium]MCH9615750.1 hypothetical protein [Chlamydiia bacterium]MCH9628847.1 hypothetical protein [Chlamydiia bacterium]
MTLKEDLKKIHDDWEILKTHEIEPHAEKFAKDIVQLDQDAKATDTEDAELIHHLLSTPWGAPFIGEMTLLDAAKSYDGNSDSPLHHLLSDFKKYSPRIKTHIFDLFDEIADDMD